MNARGGRRQCVWQPFLSGLMLMTHAKKAYRMHLNVIEGLDLIYPRDLYAFGMPVSVIRTEVEAISMKIQAVFPQFLPMDDLHEGSSYAYLAIHTHIVSSNHTPSFNPKSIVVAKQTYLTILLSIVRQVPIHLVITASSAPHRSTLHCDASIPE